MSPALQGWHSYEPPFHVSVVNLMVHKSFVLKWTQICLHSMCKAGADISWTSLSRTSTYLITHRAPLAKPQPDPSVLLKKSQASTLCPTSVTEVVTATPVLPRLHLRDLRRKGSWKSDLRAQERSWARGCSGCTCAWAPARTRALGWAPGRTLSSTHHLGGQNVFKEQRQPWPPLKHSCSVKVIW